MKNKELFEKTIDILVKAFQQDTLNYWSPCGCAVGNLCAAASGYTVIKPYKYSEGSIFKELSYILAWKGLSDQAIFRPNWTQVFSDGCVYNDNSSHKAEGEKELLATGYTIDELIKIEAAFKRGWQYDLRGEAVFDYSINSEEVTTEKQFQGLLSVYDTLCEIHEVDKTEVEKGELVFVR